MKKILIFTLGLCCTVFVIIFCACGTQEQPSHSEPSAQATQNQTENQTTESRQETTTEQPQIIEPACIADYIGMNKDEIVALIGDKFTVDYNEGSFGLTYSDRSLWLGFDPPLQRAEDEITEDMRISFADFGLKSGKIIFDIQPGMTYDEVVQSGQLPSLSQPEYSEMRDVNIAIAMIENNGKALSLTLFFDPSSSILSGGGIVLKPENEASNKNINI